MAYLELGTIIKTRGLKGVVKVYSTTDFAEERYQEGNIVYLQNKETKELVEMEVASYFFEKGFDYVSFKNYEDINKIEPFLRYAIVVKKEEVPSLPKDVYFYTDLEGCQVYDKNKGLIGKVKKVEAFNGKESLMIKLDKSNKILQLPFVNAFVKKVNIKEKRIDCELIEGMIE